MVSRSSAQAGIPADRSGFGRFAEILRDKGKFVLRHYRAGQTVVMQGDEELRVFVVKEGWGCISKCLYGGQRHLIEFPLRGDVVDFSIAAMGQQEEFSALADMVVWEGPAARMETLARAEAGASRFLADAARRQRAIFIERLAGVALRDASTRIAHFLLEISARLCLSGVPARDGYECPLTQQDLADTLGMTPIHVNRMLREARALGLYEFRRGRVRFLDYAATVEFADFDTAYLARRDGARSLPHNPPRRSDINLNPATFNI
jgi:CRP-like cAMP-binding protein